MANLTDKPAPVRPQTAKIAGIILAAGTGARMGQTKQLLPFKGRPLLAHPIEQVMAAGLSPLILVLGHRAREIQARLPGYSVDLVINPAYQSGMASSIRAGLEWLDHLQEDPYMGALFLLGDQPQVSAQTIQAILNQAHQSRDKIIIPTFRGRRGNPVYFDACFFHELKQLSGDTGGREIFRRFPGAVNEIPVNSAGICRDIDTPEEYDRLCRGKEEKIEPH